MIAVAEECVSIFRPVSGHEPAATVSIELSRAQVDRVVRAASGTEHLPWLLSQIEELRQPVKEVLKEVRPYLSRSLLVGLSLLAAFPNDGTELSITDAARLLDMHPSTTHRYVSTLFAVGLLEQNPDTRLYRRAR